MTVNRKYLDLFLEEGGELLDRLTQRVLRLEEVRGDREALASALRLAHTLKGGAKMVGLEEVSGSAHELESLLRSLSNQEPMQGDVIAGLLRLLDGVRGSLVRLGSGQGGSAVKAGMAAQGPKSAGSEVEAEDGSARVSSDRVRVSVVRLDVLQNLVDDLVLQKTRLFTRTERLRHALRGIDRFGADPDLGGLGAQEQEALRRALPYLSGRSFGEFTEEIHQLDRTLEELQGQVLDLRMVPIAESLDEFQRSVRDLAVDLGKEVGFSVEGKFTEIDRSLLEAIRAPLLHLVRNAVDHGIEGPSERAALGKANRGNVTIRAYHKGSAVVIEVEDDGRGLNPTTIREQAVRKGYLGVEEAESVTDDEAYYLLCEPGFTTAERVTQVSGRGVGLDVVRAELERLKGSLSIQSEEGAFTRFRLFLPLSVSRIPVLLVRVGSMHCALPSLFVDRCLRIRSEELAARGGTCVHGDRVLPVVSLGRILGERRTGSGRTVALAVLHFRGRHMAVQVDELVDEREVVLKALGEHLGGVPYVLGVSFLTDEQPVPVLNVVDLHPDWPRLETVCRYQADGGPRARRVLVVDDSMTTRHMERTILEGLGYEVLQASDGEDAWDKLRRETVDLVLTDVEMPGLDGLELTRRIRGSAALTGLPVVMVSNRVDERDEAAGLAAGADAYIRKDRFSQRELGATMRQLLKQGRDRGAPAPRGDR